MAEKSLNKVQLIGRLGKDAETKFTPSGVSVSNFSIACSERYKAKGSEEWTEKTEWVNCVLWRAENLAQYLTKGTRLYVEGKLQTRKWEDKEGNTRYSTEVVVADVILLGSKDGQSKPAAGSQGGAPALTDDDVPF